MSPRLLSPVFALALLTVVTAAAPDAAHAGELTVVGVSPAPRSLGAPVDTAIAVTFDRPVATGSLVPLRSFWAFGRWSGTVTGSFALSNGGQTVTLTPDQPFSAGESVIVVLSHDIEGTDGANLRDAGYSFHFWTRAEPAELELVEVDRLFTRTTPGVTSRAYGGFGSDLDGDRFLDVTIVNEDTNDLRVFLNAGDGSGTFADFIEPTFPVENVPSPSEPADFDRDGDVDVAVANVSGDSVSILLGQGDGTFGPHQAVDVGDQPRGVAVLDVDGDGDLDVANTNRVSSTVSVLLNDGSGVFSAPTSFGSGTGGEWGLAAADMNEDGILDLVVGGQDSQTIYVYAGDGDGTFTLLEAQDSGGAVWMLAVGDVDGDGHDDVTSANSGSNNGALLRGDGTGQLAAPQLVSTDPFTIATDLGDVDGDGDLDWMTSSFGGDWNLFRNDGSGGFTFDRAIPAPQAASCSLFLDVDNDGTLDLALIDELADEVIILANRGLFADGFESGDLSAWSNAVP